jgi:hypothetical protein
VAGEGIPADVLPEVALLMGEVPVVPYATTGTPALVTPSSCGGARSRPAGEPRRGHVGIDARGGRIRMESLNTRPGF